MTSATNALTPSTTTMTRTAAPIGPEGSLPNSEQAPNAAKGMVLSAQQRQDNPGDPPGRQLRSVISPRGRHRPSGGAVGEDQCGPQRGDHARPWSCRLPWLCARGTAPAQGR